MEIVRDFVSQALSPNSIWSIVLRGGIWVVIAMVIIISTDSHDQEKSLKNLKSNLGFFLMFLVLSGGLIYLLFGYTTA